MVHERCTKKFDSYAIIVIYFITRWLFCVCWSFYVGCFFPFSNPSLHLLAKRNQSHDQFFGIYFTNHLRHLICKVYVSLKLEIRCWKDSTSSFFACLFTMNVAIFDMCTKFSIVCLRISNFNVAFWKKKQKYGRQFIWNARV